MIKTSQVVRLVRAKTALVMWCGMLGDRTLRGMYVLGVGSGVSVRSVQLEAL
jgi:hypothetical protein